MAAKSKSYLDNPALQFISTALVDEASAMQGPQEAPPQAPPAPAKAARAKAQAQLREAAPAPAAEAAPASAPKFIVPIQPVYVEARSKRFNALMKPSLYKGLLEIAQANGVSVNELMHRVLEKFVEDYGEGR